MDFISRETTNLSNDLSNVHTNRFPTLPIDRCPSGTDGKRCETAPERCIGNPCMHLGRCQDFGSGLNCTCPEDYTGIGCQYEYDACQAGACKNGATCIDEGAGFTCVCPPGYTGNLQSVGIGRTNLSCVVMRGSKLNVSFSSR